MSDKPNFITVVNAFEFKEITEVQNYAHLKMLLEDDVTQARGCKYPRQPCAPSFVKSTMFHPLQTNFLLFPQIFFILVCIHAGNPRVPPRVLASWFWPYGGKNNCSFM